MHRPPHAYVPGRTERHPDGAFDAVRASVVPGASPDALAASAAFRHGLHYIETGYYWEAHEVLEPVWMALPDGSGERAFVQGLIQLANGLLKLRMGRAKAALRLSAISRNLVLDARAASVMGVRRHEVLDRIERLHREARSAS